MTENGARSIREAGGWSQVQVAAHAGVAVQTVASIERGEVARMQVGSLVRVAGAMGVSIGELVPGLGARPAEAGLKPRR